MAFEITPTSGGSPYILSAEVDQSQYIDSVHYYADILTAVQVGVCPTAGTNALPPERVATLLRTGTVNTGVASVPVGSCRSFQLVIRRVSNNEIVASDLVVVDNVE